MLDPFVGSGTTLVEAQRLNRKSIGIDLNPIACAVAKAKTLQLPAKRIIRAIETLRGEAEDVLTGQIRSGGNPLHDEDIPETVQAEKWYSPRVRRDLRRLWQLVLSCTGASRVLAEAAFSAILLPVCRETRHWGYVCDNSTPKGDHAGDVMEEFIRILERFRRAYDERDAERLARDDELEDLQSAEVICGNSAEALRDLEDGSVDLVVTSPPYFGVSDYVKAQRLSMEWFGIPIEPLRLKEIGARSKRHRTAAYEEYVSELRAVFEEVRRCLRRAGCCVVVVGESDTRESVLPEMRAAVRACGFSVDLDLNRRVSSQRKQAPSITGEHLLVLSK